MRHQVREVLLGGSPARTAAVSGAAGPGPSKWLACRYQMGRRQGLPVGVPLHPDIQVELHADRWMLAVEPFGDEAIRLVVVRGLAALLRRVRRL